MSEFQIVPSVGIWQLNPMNHALRNDYFANLLDLAVNVLPDYYAKFNSCKVLEGFVSRSSMSENELFSNSRSSGNCIVVEKPSVDDADIMQGVKDILNKKLMALSVIVDKNKIYFIKGLNNFSSINRIDDNKSILIWKK